MFVSITVTFLRQLSFITKENTSEVKEGINVLKENNTCRIVPG